MIFVGGEFFQLEISDKTPSMKVYNLLSIVFSISIVVLFNPELVGQAPFITTWKTDNPGTSANNQITIPTNSNGYLYDIDWENDGVYDDIGVTGSITHTYSSPGTYQVAITGDFPQILFDNSGDKDKILSVDQWGDIVWGQQVNAFHGCSNLAGQASDLPNLSQVSSMYRMFSDCISFNQDISGWDVSNVVNMGDMFWRAHSFNQNLGSWDVSNVIYMDNMFSQAFVFNGDIENWDVSGVQNMRQILALATSFDRDISTWDVSSVTTMESAFSSTSLGNIDLSSWNVSSVTNMYQMFGGCMLFNGDVSNWDVSNVTNMYQMFVTASNFDQDLSSWDVSSVSNFDNFLSSSGMSITNYDALLNAWSSLPSLQSNLSFGAELLNYCAGSTARQQIITDYNWTFVGDSEDCTTCTHPDYDAMIDLYTSTNGPTWTVNTGWIDGFAGTNCDPCTWFGVTCDVNDRVKELDLFSNGLSGALPTNIGDLEFLTKIYMYSNTISGSIPVSLGDLNNLELLSINNNDLTGSIPSTLGQLDNLTLMSLSGNNLSGSIPAELGDMEQLLTLSIWDNQLTGSIPAELGDISTLFHLSMGNNMLSGSIPSELGNLLNLNYIRVDNNMLSGNIPSSLGNLSNADQFWLANNQLTGTIPSSFSGLTGTVEFKIHNNMLEGCIPSSLQAICSNVQFADISGNPDLDTQSWDDFCNTQEGICPSSQNDACVNHIGVSTLDQGKILGYDKDFDMISDIYTSTSQIIGLNMDRVQEVIYFITGDHLPSSNQFEYKIQKVNFDGTGHTVLLDNILTNANHPDGSGFSDLTEIIYNDVSGELFFILDDYLGEISDSYCIASCNDDGTNFSIIKSNILNHGLAINVGTQKLYYRNSGIENCDLDGTNTSSVSSANGIDVFIDGEANKLYYYDPFSQEIGRCDVDGSNLEVLHSNVVPSGHIEFNYNTNSVLGVSAAGFTQYNLDGTTASISGYNGFIFASNGSNYWTKIEGCDECGSNNYNPLANFDDGSCESCTDGIQNGDETGIDCGGSNCMPCCQPVDYVIPQVEYDALVDFYYTTDGPNWQNTVDGVNPWFEDCDPCGIVDGTPWFGLSCTINNRISQIYMPNNNMEGSMPASLNMFSELTWFNVNGDYDYSTPDLSGPIPDVSLLNLNHFGIGRNQIIGTVPSDFSNMTNLNTFYVPRNNLSGSLPILGPNQPFLKDIRFDYNNFTGGIPFQYGNISLLHAFTVNNNDLSGCYPQELRGICGNTVITVTNSQVSDGNNFAEPWEDFCNYSSGGCCEEIVSIELDTLAPGDYYATEQIIVKGNLRIDDSIYLHAPLVSMPVNANSLLEDSYMHIDTDGCPDNASLNFDGTNDFVNLPSYSTQGDLTISMWFKMDQSNVTQFDNRLMSILESNGQQFEIGVAVNTNNIWMYENNNGTTIYGPSLDDGKWHQLVVVRESSTLQVYIDGNLEYSLANADTDWGDIIYLGRCGCGGSGHYWDGDMDEFYLYPEAKSSEYVMDTLFCSEYDLNIGADIYYDFDNHVPNGDNTSVSEIEDISSNGNDGTLVGFSLIGSESNFAIDSNPAACCDESPSFTCLALTVNLTVQDTDNDGIPNEGGYAYVLASDFVDADNHPCGLETNYTFSTLPSDTLILFDCNDFGPTMPITIYGTDINGSQTTCNTTIVITDNIPLCDGQ